MKVFLILLVVLIASKWKGVAGGFCQNQRNSATHCEKIEVNKTDKILCTGEFNHSYTEYTKLRTLVICNVGSNGYDPRVISHFQHLYRFTLIYSNITYFTQPFPEHLHLQVLNLTHLGIHRLQVDVFRNLKFLKILDLSYNRLRSFGKHHSEFLPSLQQLYLRGNKWECNAELKWILGKRHGNLSRKVADLNRLVCSDSKFEGKSPPALTVMTMIKNLELECPRRGDFYCKCKLDNVVQNTLNDRTWEPVITVNCSNMDFTELPAQLPNRTKNLIINNNKIANVTPLLNNSWYRGVSYIDLENNRISFVDQLEGSDWLVTFNVLNLRGNNLTTLPTYAFDNAFEKNSNILAVYLENNSWVCDCSFTPKFQDLLKKHRRIIYDWERIRCAESNHDLNSYKVIKDLPLVSICMNPNSFPLSVWDIINAVLTFLIGFVLVKFLYDYWVYKTTAQLPWIASKIP
ncbi:leucine rich repeat [Nesidiocoris tenuis]|uniref:Leucine rich repeat n=1 Tax=Nesidiocoris tenuis TaxID=355587 RepID=A0ABN7AR66_9HEMI|nr:leucine rich repeat [Nesidiocoris tenuis]